MNAHEMRQADDGHHAGVAPVPHIQRQNRTHQQIIL
jgi:hypothetical protein